MKSTRPVAVITGAARGIGKGCALELARGGFNLLINDLPDADSVEFNVYSGMIDKRSPVVLFSLFSI